MAQFTDHPDAFTLNEYVNNGGVITSEVFSYVVLLTNDNHIKFKRLCFFSASNSFFVGFLGVDKPYLVLAYNINETEQYIKDIIDYYAFGANHSIRINTRLFPVENLLIGRTDVSNLEEFVNEGRFDSNLWRPAFENFVIDVNGEV